MVSALFKVAVVAIAAWITIRFLSKDEIILTDLLRGKNVLLTGASSGIGEETAYYYAKLGANVVIAARRETLLQKVVAKCQQLSPTGRFKYLVTDFSKDDTADKLVKDAISFLGSLDYLFLNHAYTLSTTSEHTVWIDNKDRFDKLKYSMDVNFMSYVKAADAALPHLKKTNGSILAMSSLIIVRPVVWIPYAASKSALGTFFAGLRQELKLRGENVSVTVVHLGVVATESERDGTKSISNSLNDGFIEEVNKMMPVTSPAKCAEDIVEIFTRRESEVYYPYNQLPRLSRLIAILTKDADALDWFGADIFKFIMRAKKTLFTS